MNSRAILPNCYHCAKNFCIRTIGHTFAHVGIMFKYYKGRFRRALQPVFVMLIDRKSKMDYDEWQNYVSYTLTRVLENPLEFLGEDMPSPSLTSDIVKEIFSEFMKEKGKRVNSLR